MKRLRITVLEKDVDVVLKFLGRRGLIQFSSGGTAASPQPDGLQRPPVEAAGVTGAPASTGAAALPDAAEAAGSEAGKLKHIEKTLAKIKEAGDFLCIELPSEPFDGSDLPAEEEERAVLLMCDGIDGLAQEIYNIGLEKSRLQDHAAASGGILPEGAALAAHAESSFLNVRLGRLDAKKQEALQKKLKGRAVVVPVGNADTVLVASSKTGRFAMDSELSGADFVPLSSDGTEAADDREDGVQRRLAGINETLASLDKEKERLYATYAEALRQIYASFLMAESVARLKQRLFQTKNTFELSGWAEAAVIPHLVKELDRKTDGRVSAIAYESWEVSAVQSGVEKVPVVLKHGRFVRSFEPLVLSYGAPPYGSIDPTPFSAVLFALLFAIMFGDLGQGAVLFVLGLIAGRSRSPLFAKNRHFSGPLKIAGACSMVTGLLYGGVFSNETLLEGPTKAVTGFLAQTALGRFFGIHETERILNLMPEAGNLEKLFYFFGFTLAIGALINTLGIILNIVGSFALRRYDRALFSKHGLAGLLFFWYAISIAVRAIVQKDGFRFAGYDAAGLAVPVFFIVARPFIWNLIQRRTLFEEGFFAFVMEGIVEILETISGYISNTVSFLRVGAFALSHAVLSFIIFTMAEKVAHAPFGPALSLVIIIFGNIVIIVLEGMIVAIQVVRLQYYEFFGKFFTETGKEFSPFKFKNRKN
jgi:V/A-type H+-transporting ATPase subunit I